ncbi:MAG: porin family protein [Gammaproteobacteria bacterium]|nr:porin family protein [Gammaproteobacteria bacterium]
MYRNFLASALLAAILIPIPSHAADGFYIGAVGGIMDNDRSGFDDAINAGVTLGYEFLGVGIGDIAVEGTYTATINDADAPRGQGDWEIDTLGVYGVFRSAGPVYFKAKGGLVSADISVGRSSDDDTEFSAGLGFGFSVGIAQFELEYTNVDDNVDFISVAILFATPF